MVLAVILKTLAIIGWILLGILGLILLILLIVCLVPVRYRAEAHASDTLSGLSAKAHATWLLHLVRADIVYADLDLKGEIRIAWKKISLTDDEEESDSDTKEKKPEKKEDKKVQEEKKAEEKKAEEKKAEEKPENTVQYELTKKPDHKVAEKTDRKEKREERKEKSGIAKRIGSFIEKVRFTFERIYDTINEIIFAGEDVFAFLDVPVHRKVLRHAKKRILKFFRKILPRRYEARGVIGFEDPYHTGEAAALMSVLYPRTGDRAAVRFDFENRVCDLDGSFKGIIRMGSVPALLLPMLLDWKTWRTVKDAKELKRKLDKSKEIIEKGGMAA